MPFFVAHTLQNDDCKRGSNHAKKASRIKVCRLQKQQRQKPRRLPDPMMKMVQAAI